MKRSLSFLIVASLLSACGDDASLTCGDGTWQQGSGESARCVAWTACGAGEYETAPGTGTADRQCAPCPQGQFNTVPNATSCTAWSDCSPGKYIKTEGAASADRVCETCATGSYTDQLNQPGCIAHTKCQPGTFVSIPGDEFKDVTCDACGEGSYSDMENMSGCIPQPDCPAGTFAEVPASVSQRRSCSTCVDGTFNTMTNAAYCMLWTRCKEGFTEDVVATTINDRTCMFNVWTQQFGTEYGDSGTAVHVERDDRIIVASRNSYPKPSDSSQTQHDILLQALDQNGAEIWSHRLAPDAYRSVTATETTRNGDLVLMGNTNGPLAESSGVGGMFIKKLNNKNEHIWTRQFGTAGNSDYLTSGCVDSHNNIIIAGYTNGSSEHTTQIGNGDAYLRKYDTNGNVQWTSHFGTNKYDRITSVTTDKDNNIIVLGITNGTLADPNKGYQDIFVRKYGPAGDIKWTKQIGTLHTDDAYSITTSADSSIFISGKSSLLLVSNIASDNYKLFVMKLNPHGTTQKTTMFGTDDYSEINTIKTTKDNNIIIFGTTRGDFTGQGNVSLDVFIRKHNAAGDHLWTKQFGSDSDDWARGGALSSTGAIIVTGYTDGAMTETPNHGGSDAFIARVEP